MRAILIFGLLMGVFTENFSQLANFHLNFSGQPLMVKTYEGVDGTPYFNTDWRTGTIVYEDKRIENVQMKYNAFEDHVVIYYNERPFIPDERLVKGFEFSKTDETGGFRYYNFKNGFEGDGISKEDYLAVLYEGEIVLAERIKCDQLAVTPAAYGQRQVKQFVISKNYVLVKNGVAEKFKPSKGAFIKRFPDLGEKIKNYIKANKINFGDVDDLIKIMTFIETNIK